MNESRALPLSLYFCRSVRTFSLLQEISYRDKNSDMPDTCLALLILTRACETDIIDYLLQS